MKKLLLSLLLLLSLSAAGPAAATGWCDTFTQNNCSWSGEFPQDIDCQLSVISRTCGACSDCVNQWRTCININPWSPVLSPDNFFGWWTQCEHAYDLCSQSAQSSYYSGLSSCPNTGILCPTC